MTIDLDSLIRDYLAIETKIESLTERKEQILTQLRGLDEGRHAGSVGTVTVAAPTRRFDPKRAAELLPAELLTLCQETTITAAAAKRALPPALYEQCQVASSTAKPRVTVKSA